MHQLLWDQKEETQKPDLGEEGEKKISGKNH